MHLVEQARVLDRDHRLSGEVLDQFDLPVGERFNLGLENGDNAQQCLFAHHRNSEHRSVASPNRPARSLDLVSTIGPAAAKPVSNPT